MMKSLSLCALLAFSVAAADDTKVPVVLLAEAGCPFCQAAILGPLSALVGNASSIITLDEIPFGNNYFETVSCGGAPYDPDTRHCWAALCVEPDTPGADDCFNSTVVPQHGESEAAVDRSLACAKGLAPDWQTYWNFLVCMESNYADEGTDAMGGCADDSGLDANAVEACYDSEDGDAAVVTVAKATFDHDAVPYLTVDGQEVDPDDALDAVCQAYKGPKQDLPPACVEILMAKAMGEMHNIASM